MPVEGAGDLLMQEDSFARAPDHRLPGWRERANGIHRPARGCETTFAGIFSERSSVVETGRRDQPPIRVAWITTSQGTFQTATIAEAIGEVVVWKVNPRSEPAAKGR
jgi:hypothetical protein